MDWVLGTGAAFAAAAMLIGAWITLHGKLTPTIEQKRQRQLDEAQDNLLLAEASLLSSPPIPVDAPSSKGAPTTIVSPAMPTPKPKRSPASVLLGLR